MAGYVPISSLSLWQIPTRYLPRYVSIYHNTHPRPLETPSRCWSADDGRQMHARMDIQRLAGAILAGSHVGNVLQKKPRKPQRGNLNVEGRKLHHPIWRYLRLYISYGVVSSLSTDNPSRQGTRPASIFREKLPSRPLHLHTLFSLPGLVSSSSPALLALRRTLHPYWDKLIGIHIKSPPQERESRDKQARFITAGKEGMYGIRRKHGHQARTWTAIKEYPHTCANFCLGEFLDFKGREREGE